MSGLVLPGWWYRWHPGSKNVEHPTSRDPSQHRLFHIAGRFFLCLQASQPCLDGLRSCETNIYTRSTRQADTLPYCALVQYQIVLSQPKCCLIAIITISYKFWPKQFDITFFFTTIRTKLCALKFTFILLNVNVE